MKLGPRDEKAAIFGAGIPLPVVVWLGETFTSGLWVVLSRKWSCVNPVDLANMHVYAKEKLFGWYFEEWVMNWLHVLFICKFITVSPMKCNIIQLYLYALIFCNKCYLHFSLNSHYGTMLFLSKLVSIYLI